jgi:signal transduction histidine kinase
MEDKINSGNQKSPDTIHSPVKLLIIIALSIVVSDILIRVIILSFPSLSKWSDVLADSVLTMIILFPVLYFFVFRPLTISISERRKAEDETKLKNEILLATNAEKDKFFSILAHDLRGPMSAFVSITELLSEDIEFMSQDEIKELILSMKSDSVNLYRLLENLLEWSRLKRGAIEFNPEKLNLKNSIISGIGVVSASSHKKGIIIDISVADELLAFADKHMFETVIRNLVSNAVKFTHSGGRVDISANLSQDHNIEVKITDTGIGMEPEMIRKLFLINEKTSRKGTEGEPSSGLGLLLCKEFVERHGCRIWLTSEPGNGTTFFFTVPIIS